MPLKNIPALRAKGLHRGLLEHKGELLPSWYREAVEQELNSENQKRWGCVFLMKIYKRFAQMLGAVGCCWVMLLYSALSVGICCRMYVDVCWCMLVYADVC